MEGMGCERRPRRKAGLDAVGHSTDVEFRFDSEGNRNPAAGLRHVTCVCDVVWFMILKD